MKNGSNSVTNYIQDLSSLIGLPPLMGRVLQAQENKSEMSQGRRERERERKRERENERERERERENTTGTLHQQALKVKYSNHHTHISNNSISCRYNLTWSPMYCTQSHQQNDNQTWSRQITIVLSCNRLLKSVH